MISCSHWGMFRYPLRLIVAPAMTPEEEQQMLREWDRPSAFIEIPRGQSIQFIEGNDDA